MAVEDIFARIPQHKFDTGSVERLNTATAEEVEPILWQLLEWIKDVNWPVAAQLMQVLPRFHRQLVPHIHRILAAETEDAIWKNAVLSLLKDVPHTTVLLVEKDIKRIAAFPTKEEQLEETDGYAREIVAGFSL